MSVMRQAKPHAAEVTGAFQTEPTTPLKRNSVEAYRQAKAAYPYKCCVVCGLQTALAVAHLDQAAGNNDPDNLAYLCHTHHFMFDSGLYPLEAIKLMRAHWQETQGVLSHAARMKDAGPKAAATRKRRAAARKAWATRKAGGAV